jgi:putative transposase
MKYQFIARYSSAYGVERMCRVLEASRSGFYDWRNRPCGKRSQENEKLLMAIRESYHKSKGNYGSPRIMEDLREKGIRCGENRIAKIMKVNGIVAKSKRKSKVTTNSKHNLPVTENLLQQQFVATGPNKVWCSDITYIQTLEGWLYLVVILYVYSRRVVGWAMSERLTADFVMRALYQAIGRRNPALGCIFHSDRGVQYALF